LFLSHNFSLCLTREPDVPFTVDADVASHDSANAFVFYRIIFSFFPLPTSTIYEEVSSEMELPDLVEHHSEAVAAKPTLMSDHEQHRSMQLQRMLEHQESERSAFETMLASHTIDHMPTADDAAVTAMTTCAAPSPSATEASVEAQRTETTDINDEQDIDEAAYVEAREAAGTPRVVQDVVADAVAAPAAAAAMTLTVMEQLQESIARTRNEILSGQQLFYQKQRDEFAQYQREETAAVGKLEKLLTSITKLKHEQELEQQRIRDAESEAELIAAEARRRQFEDSLTRRFITLTVSHDSLSQLQSAVEKLRRGRQLAPPATVVAPPPAPVTFAPVVVSSSSPPPPPASTTGDELVVYITATGKRYHHISCRYMPFAYLSRSDATVRGYSECGHCGGQPFPRSAIETMICDHSPSRCV
jgi:hypothetical protein